MSLDVYLTLPGPEKTREAEGIFIRRDGATVEITRAEWDELYPGRKPVTVTTVVDEREVYTGNITHNLGEMAGEVGLYDPLWRPDEHGIIHASQLIDALRDGLARLGSERDRLQAFNPENGWGSHELLVNFVAGYLAACERWPEAEVSVWR